MLLHHVQTQKYTTEKEAEILAQNKAVFIPMADNSFALESLQSQL